jgi:hypothetical protein
MIRPPFRSLAPWLYDYGLCLRKFDKDTDRLSSWKAFRKLLMNAANGRTAPASTSFQNAERNASNGFEVSSVMERPERFLIREASPEAGA